MTDYDNTDNPEWEDGQEERQLTYEEVLAILEEEILLNDPDNPYKPLNFHDPDESY